MKDEDIKKRIKACRKECCLTQQEMADRLGLSRNSYMSIENGATRLINDNLEKIAVTMDMSLEELVLGYTPEQDVSRALRDERSSFQAEIENLKKRHEAALREKDERIEMLQKIVSSQEETIASQKSIIALLQK